MLFQPSNLFRMWGEITLQPHVDDEEEMQETPVMKGPETDRWPMIQLK